MKKIYVLLIFLFAFISLKAQEQTLLADFPLKTDGSDASGQSDALVLINVSFKTGSAYSKGIYGDYENGEGNLIMTQYLENLDLQNFTVNLSFKVRDYAEMPVFVIGQACRLLGVYLMSDGTLELRANNMNNIKAAYSEVNYAKNKWQNLEVQFKGNKIALILNDQIIVNEDFSLDIDCSTEYSDKNLSNVNFSNGEIFKGHWKNLKIYNGVSLESFFENDGNNSNQNQEEEIEEVLTDSNNGTQDLQIFTSKTCGRCRMSKQFLSANNIAFQELDVDDNKANNSKMWNLLFAKGVNQVTFPVVISGGELSYNIEDLQGFLNNLKNKKGGVQNVNTDNNENNDVSENISAVAKEYVDRHNYWRSQLKIAPVKWSDELAKYAQAWADELGRQNCKMEHRPREGKWKQIYGENIYWASGFMPTAKDVVDSWASERKDYNHNTQECNGGWYPCGHYTQVIWEKSTQIGCASFKCSDGSVVVVCNYNPPGNYSGEKAYKKK